MEKFKDEERILRAERGKQQITYKGTPIRLSADFTTELWRSEGTGSIYLK